MNTDPSIGTRIDEDDTSEEVDDAAAVEFTKTMRIATRKVHKMSDALVNAKLGIAMSNDKIWAEGLLIFYEIFRFLEEALGRLSSRSQVFNKIEQTLVGIERTKAFEEDLEFYFGNDFIRTYTIRPSVANYLRHLKTLEEREPLRLVAYIYHLYMGLLSGGQILKKKRDLSRKLTSFGGMFSIDQSSSGAKGGDAVTRIETDDGRTISDIKKEITFTMNDIATDLSKDEKDSLISESILVFQYNNEIIRSVKHTGKVAALTLVSSPIVISFIMILVVLFLYLFW